MFYINLGKETNKIQISHEEILVKYPTEQDDIHVYSDENRITIIDGFFFNLNDIKHEKFINSPNLAKSISQFDENELEKLLIDVDGFFNVIRVCIKTKKVVAFSDHVGSRSLYFNYNKECVYISDDIQNNLNFSGLKMLNKEKLLDYFTFMSDQGSSTFFKGINQIGPREKINFSNSSYERKTYFDFLLELNSNSLDENATLLRDIFLNSVSNCAEQGQGNLYSAVSGGLDSSSITSTLATLGIKDFTAKTAIFHDIKNNDHVSDKSFELNYALEVIKKYNIKHEKVMILNNGCITSLEDSLKIFPEPKNLVNGYIHNSIFKTLANSKATYLDGYAGDSVINHGYSLFLQYARQYKFLEIIREDKLLHLNKGAPYSLKRTFLKYILPSFLPQRFLWQLDSWKGDKNIFKKFEKRINKEYRSSNLLNRIINKYGIYPNSFETTPEQWHLMNISSDEITSSIRDARHLAKNYGINILFPFLSKSLIQFSLSIPVSQKLKKGVDRYVFRESMRNILPSKIYKRHTKSDLSHYSQSEMSNVKFTDIKNILIKHTGNFFDIDYLETELFDKRNNFTETYQIYEFAKWVEKNHIFLE